MHVSYNEWSLISGPSNLNAPVKFVEPIVKSKALAVENCLKAGFIGTVELY